MTGNGLRCFRRRFGITEVVIPNRLQLLVQFVDQRYPRWNVQVNNIRIRNLVEIFEEDSFKNLINRIGELENYFKTQYPGKKDLPYIQQLKGMTREWEADILWAYFGFTSESVIHSRLGFYKGDIFTEEPEIGRDVIPVLDTIKKINPTIITVALDPEGSGPDTHYKVLQTVFPLVIITQSAEIHKRHRNHISCFQGR